jgi:hypothetical protein
MCMSYFFPPNEGSTFPYKFIILSYWFGYETIDSHFLNEHFECSEKKDYNIQICFFPLEKFGSEKRLVGLSYVGGYAASCETADLIFCD